MKRHLLLITLSVLLTSLQATAAEEAYYLVGWLNDWSQNDKSYPLTTTDNGQTWHITVPAAGDRGWFKIAPENAYGQSNFFHHLLCAPYDGCRELSGTMVLGNGGAWRLPNVEGAETFTISINPSELLFNITTGGTPAKPAPWSGTLPVMFISTQQPVTSKEVYVDGTYYVDAMGLDGYEPIGSADNPLPLQMKGRGNYTWKDFDKKPYRLKLAEKAPLLGMESSRHFNLIAHPDDQLGFLRNTVGFQLSRLLSLPYTPDQQPVEVVLNGDYIGLYMLTDKIRVDKHRVNIVEQADMQTHPDSITGGWLLEIDNYESDGQISFAEGNGSWLRFTLHSPEVLSEAQRNYITTFLQATDRAIYSTDKSDTRWESYVDLSTLARFYIVQEMMDNAESFHGSCYLSKDFGANSKLMFGPVWDFGNSFHRGFDRFIYQDPPFGQSWIGEMARFPRFQQEVKTIWQSFIGREYLQLQDFIDDFIAQITAAAKSDGARWPAYAQGNMSQKKEDFCRRLASKVDFLKRQWGEGNTGIADHQLNNTQPADVRNLSGQRILTPRRGVYILNGKKVMAR